MQAYEVQEGQFKVSTDQKLIDLDLTHSLIFESYWAKGIPISTFEKSLRNSLCFGLFKDKIQIGFARVVSDYATFAYLGDVFIIDEFKGRGLSKLLMNSVMSHPELQGLRRFCLGTKDAQRLYRKYGFEEIKVPQNWMEIKTADIYSKKEVTNV